MENLWDDYFLNDTQKTFEDIVKEGVEPSRDSDERLRKNIRESMEKNAEIWEELARA